MKHLAKDPEAYLRALKRGAPFYRTACGDTFSRNFVTASPEEVFGCYPCMEKAHGLLAKKGSGSSPEAESSGIGDLDASFTDFDLDDFEGAADLDGDPEPGTEVPPDPEPSESGGFNLGPMLEMTLAKYDFGGMGIEEYLELPKDQPPKIWLSEKESAFIEELIGLSQMIGADGLAGRVIALLDLACSRAAVEGPPSMGRDSVVANPEEDAGSSEE